MTDATVGAAMADAAPGDTSTGETSTDGSAAGDGGCSATVRRWLPVVVAVLAATPILAALAKMIGDHWYPAGDMAQAELHMRGFFRHPPLVGAAGRIVSNTGVQGSHPGPSLWVAMYPVYALFGGTSFGLMAGVVGVHLVSLFGALWLAMRRGGLVLMMIVALALSLVIRASGPAFAIEPWNPWLAVLPFAVFLLAAWSVVDGARGCWPLAAIAGWHAIQCHAGYAPIVAATMAGVFVADAIGGRRARDLAQRWRMWGLVGVVTALMWLPPIIDQLKRTPGNLSILWQHFVSPRESVLPKGLVGRIIVDQFSLSGPWIAGPELPGPGGLAGNLAGFLLLAALWIAGFSAALRLKLRAARRLHVLLGGTSLVGGVAISRIFGGYFEYTIRWVWVLVALAVATSLWSIWQAHPRVHRWLSERVVAWVALVGIVVSGVIGSIAVHDKVIVPGAPDSETVGTVAPLLAAELDPGLHYLIRWQDSSGLGATAFGLLLELERHGYHVGVDLPSAAAALPHRVLPEQSADGVIKIIAGSRADTMMVPVTSKIVAFYEPRNELQYARYEVLRQQLLAYAEAAGRADLTNIIAGDGGSLVFISPPLPPEQAALALELQRLPQPVLILLDPKPG